MGEEWAAKDGRGVGGEGWAANSEFSKRELLAVKTWVKRLRTGFLG
jgi:hypothetical protein